MSESSLQRKTFLGHPIGLYVLFFTEMWERFSYYGMRYILVLFLIKGLQWSEAAAYTTYGFYGMFVYLAGIPGGILADRYLGKKKAVFIGGIFQCIGHLLLAFEGLIPFFSGLVALIIGTGLIKSNISALVGALYKKGDPQKDKGFGIFYTGINIGALLAGFIVTTVAELKGWHYGFSLAAIGMVIGMTAYVLFQHYIPVPEDENISEGGLKKVGLASLASSLVLGALFFGVTMLGYGDAILAYVQQYRGLILNGMAVLFTLIIIRYLIHFRMNTKLQAEKDRIIALGIALFMAFIFFVGFEQAGGLLTIYCEKYTNRAFGPWTLPASSGQNFNPLFIVMFATLVSTFCVYLKKRSKYYNATFQMALGNIIMGLGFLFMIGACLQREGAIDPNTAQSGLYWLVGAYFFHSIGELFLSPVILSFATNLAPKGASSMILGIVFAVFGLSNHFAAQFGALSENYSEKTLFFIAFAIPFFCGLLFLFLNKKVIALTHGAEQEE